MFFQRLTRVTLAYLRACSFILMALTIFIGLPIVIPLTYLLVAVAQGPLHGLIGVACLAFGIIVAWCHGRPIAYLVYWVGLEYIANVHQEPWSAHRE
jgi:hypothetical protein